MCECRSGARAGRGWSICPARHAPSQDEYLPKAPKAITESLPKRHAADVCSVAEPRGARAPRSKPSVLKSSSRSGQWMPYPAPARSQWFHCSDGALSRRGNRSPIHQTNDQLVIGHRDGANPDVRDFSFGQRSHANPPKVSADDRGSSAGLGRVLGMKTRHLKLFRQVRARALPLLRPGPHARSPARFVHGCRSRIAETKASVSGSSRECGWFIQ